MMVCTAVSFSWETRSREVKAGEGTIRITEDGAELLFDTHAGKVRARRGEETIEAERMILDMEMLTVADAGGDVRASSGANAIQAERLTIEKNTSSGKDAAEK